MKLLDIARGLYVRSPASLKRAIAPLVALAPTSLKYGKAYRAMRETIARSAVDVQFTEERQAAMLRALLAKAHAGSAFYRGIIEQALGDKPDFATLTREDMLKLPVLTKQDLSAAGEAALAVPVSQLDLSTTSGSNGEQPFAFYRDKDRSVREIAFVNHIWGRTGLGEADARAVLRGFRLDDSGATVAWDPALRELKLSVFPLGEAEVGRYLDLIDARGIRYINSYPSALELFCRIMLQMGRKPRLPIKGVLPISEPLLPHQRAIISAALGEPVIVPFYGLSEKTLFAGEVPGEPDVYEFEPLYGLAELVDEAGRPVTEIGAEGRLVGTGFISTGMPFIRYDSQDRAVLVRPATRENGWRLRVRAIAPRRKPGYLIGKSGQRIVTTDFTPEEPAFFAAIDEMQFFQERPGHSTIKYIPSRSATAHGLERMRAELEQKTEGEIAFDLLEVESLLASSNGKRPFIDQRIPS